MSRSLSAITVLLVISSLVFTNHATPLEPADINRSISLAKSNVTASSEAATTPTRIITYSPGNFLGINCYHLQPSTVSENSCQPLFAKLVEHGDAYKEKEYPNGWRYQPGHDPCVIMLSSPSRKDRRVKITAAHMLLYAMEILQTCQESSTGGAYTFVGNWQLVVTREKIKITLGAGNLAEEEAFQDYTRRIPVAEHVDI